MAKQPDKRTPDEDRGTVHVRCGSDIREPLRRAGFRGRFVEFSDPYCQGPVTAAPRLPFLRGRARFGARAYEIGERAALRRLAAAEAALARTTRARHAVLWFEHDSYDQLILARLLAAFAGRRPRRLELVCADRYPGIERFIGLGQLAPAQLRRLWEARRPVTAADRRLGRTVWEALRGDDPLPLWVIASRGTPAIPPMAAALRRHLRELPGARDGLSLTERLILRALRDGPAKGADLFRRYTAREPLPYLGDTMFFHAVRELASGPRPALAARGRAAPWPRRRLALTDFGRALLAGRADWVAAGGRERWVGGIRAAGGFAPWRWRHGRGPVRGG